MYVLHIEAQYRKQILMNVNEDIDNNTIIVGDINTPLMSVDGSSTQKISKETDVQLFFRSNGLNRYVYRTFHPITAKAHSFKCTWDILQDTLRMAAPKNKP